MTNDLRKKKNFSFSRHFPFMTKDQSDSEDAFNVEPIERKYKPSSRQSFLDVMSHYVVSRSVLTALP